MAVVSIMAPEPVMVPPYVLRKFSPPSELTFELVKTTRPSPISRTLPAPPKRRRKRMTLVPDIVTVEVL